MVLFGPWAAWLASDEISTEDPPPDEHRGSVLHYACRWGVRVLRLPREA